MHSQSAPGMSTDTIQISDITPADLSACFVGNDEAFPSFWAMVESLPRPPHADRQARFCTRWQKLLQSPDMWCRKAVDTANGAVQLAAITLWHRPGATIFNRKRREPGEEDEAWVGIDNQAWEAVWGSWDKTRLEIMDTFPHWYEPFPLPS